MGNIKKLRLVVIFCLVISFLLGGCGKVEPHIDETIQKKFVSIAKDFMRRDVIYTNDYIDGGKVEDHFINPTYNPDNALKMDCSTFIENVFFSAGYYDTAVAKMKASGVSPHIYFANVHEEFFTTETLMNFAEVLNTSNSLPFYWNISAGSRPDFSSFMNVLRLGDLVITQSRSESGEINGHILIYAGNVTVLTSTSGSTSIKKGFIHCASSNPWFTTNNRAVHTMEIGIGQETNKKYNFYEQYYMPNSRTEQVTGKAVVKIAVLRFD